MTDNKVVEKLFRLKGLRVVGPAIAGREDFVITMKPYKNGCRGRPPQMAFGTVCITMVPRRPAQMSSHRRKGLQATDH